MGLQKKNNPLGQRKVSDQVGSGLNPDLTPNNSEDFVEQVKRNAKHPAKRPKTNTTPDPLNESGFNRRKPGPQSR